MSDLLFFLFGIAAGTASCAGVFAFLMKIGIYSRMIGSTHTIRAVKFYEWMIVGGIICGGIYTQYPNLTLHVGYWFVVLWGLCAGIFVGCTAAALAEVLSVLPILFRRLDVDCGLTFYMFMMALGKMTGSLWYFYHGLEP
jgi:stage V sporulation protein AB